jgi:site-specific recombinase XerD
MGGSVPSEVALAGEEADPDGSVAPDRDGHGADAGGGAVVQLRRTVATAVGDGFPAGVDAAVVLRRAGVREGQPFMLGADGLYDVNLNRFFRELDGWGVRSQNGIAAYSRDVMLFCRFLHESRGGKTIWECDGADLRAFKVARLRTPGPHQVSASTWRRSIAALDKWVRWSIGEGLLAAEPFRYVDRSVVTPQGVKQLRVNAEQEPDPPTRPVAFLPFEDYLLWRNVGLRGELPDGSEDPTWRGRHGERNALFADLLVYSGMRLGEAASLLVGEVPALAGTRLVGALQVSAAVAKRGKGRTVFVNQRTLRGLHHYLEIERDGLVSRHRAAGAYDVFPDALGVRGLGRHALTLTDKRGSWSYAKLDVATRQRLVRMADGRAVEPLWLWLGEGGRPVQAATWQSAFRRANQRCTRFDLPLEVHPHTLRHTFAVHMLGLLLRQTVRALGQREDQRLTHAEVKRLLIGNPMRKLQLLLGHSDESTVYTYLDVLDEAQEIVLSALAEWDVQAEVLDQGADGTEVGR